MWQDIIIAGVGILFSIMLIPQVISSLNGAHVNKKTSLSTALGLYVLSGTYATLGMWTATVCIFFNATMWLVVWGLSIRRN